MKRLLLNTASIAVAATAFAAAMSVAASAQEDEGLTISGNVGLFSDYRFRGVSQTDEGPAVQGGFDLATPSGFHVDTWASSINFASGTEIDVWGGYAFAAGGLNFDVGLYGYLYPNNPDGDLDLYEVIGSVGKSFGSLSTTFGFNYAPDQDNLDENTYLYAKGSLPIGSSPFSLAGSLGYTDGSLDFSDDGDGFLDWSLGISTSLLGVTVGATYVDTSEHIEGLTDATVVFSISKVL